VSETLKRLLRERTELVILVVILLSTQMLRTPSVPFGVYVLGVASASGLALQAVGIVLVYRTNRIINFAQAELGILGGSIFLEFARNRMLLRGLQKICPPCLPAPGNIGELMRSHDPAVLDTLSQLPAGSVPGPATPLSQAPDVVDSLPRGSHLSDLAVRGAPGWLVHLNFWLSMALAVAVVLLVSYVVYALIIRRFDRAPRLIATVVTIGIAEILATLTKLATSYLQGSPSSDEAVVFVGKAQFPFTWTLHTKTVTFGTADILGVIVTGIALAVLAVFFMRSSLGVVLRGSSENPDRAQTLGVNVGGVNAIVWMMAGGLSVIASVLIAAGTGVGAGNGANLVKYLAAAVIGGLTSIPLAAAAALTIGILDQSIGWGIKTPGAIDGILLVVIVVVQLFQRTRGSRVDTEDAGWKAAREMRPIPDELKDLEVVKRWVRTAKVIGTIVILGIPWVFSPSQTNLAAVTLIYGIIALSLLVLTGWAGQISLGHFAFAAIGAWFTVVLDWPFPLSVIAGGLAGGVVAVIIGLPALRLKGLQLAVSTLAFAVAVTSVLLNPAMLGKALPSGIKRPGVIGLDLDDQRTFYYFTLVFLGLAIAMVVGLRRSRTARALIAARENEPAAQSVGINLLRARLGAFAVSGFMAAFAGGLFAISQYGVNVSSFGYDQSIKMFLMVVIGGTGSIAGPLVGAAYVGLADIVGGSATGIIAAVFSSAATGFGVVVVLLFAPGGLGEVGYRMRDAMLRRVADRYRIDVPSLIADRAGQKGRPYIGPKVRTGGGTVFVPKRYRADGQWSVDRRHEDATRV
jgi:branched-chain amino acid transport system permease protein